MTGEERVIEAQEEILRRIGKLETQMEVRAVEVSRTLTEILGEARATNGRVGVLERWKEQEQLTKARAEGFAAATASIALTRKQVTGIIATLGTASAIGTAVIGLVFRASA